MKTGETEQETHTTGANKEGRQDERIILVLVHCCFRECRAAIRSTNAAKDPDVLRGDVYYFRGLDCFADTIHKMILIYLFLSSDKKRFVEDLLGIPPE